MSDETDALFQGATKALTNGQAGDAIGAFEALADRGVLDAAVSYDRGLAYALRVRIGAEAPGDLGRAAQGFEEARTLATDARLAADAEHALATIRAEVARRRGRSGDPVELDQGLSLGRTVMHLLPEDVWSAGAALASLVVGVALFTRWLTQSRRTRVGATITCAIAAPLLLVLASLAVAMRDERLHRREAVVVTAGARPSDERGIALPGASPLPEAALVEVVATRPGWTRVRWGNVDAWVPGTAVRAVARPE